jgi:hypothetical protein
LSDRNICDTLTMKLVAKLRSMDAVRKIQGAGQLGFVRSVSGAVRG